MKKLAFYLWSTRKPNGQPVTVSRRGNLLRQQIGTRPDPNWPEQLPDTQEPMAPAEALPIQLTWLNWLRDNLQENLADPSWDKIKKEMEEGILNDLGGAKRWVEDTQKEIQAAETVLPRFKMRLHKKPTIRLFTSLKARLPMRPIPDESACGMPADTVREIMGKVMGEGQSEAKPGSDTATCRAMRQGP